LYFDLVLELYEVTLNLYLSKNKTMKRTCLIFLVSAVLFSLFFYGTPQLPVAIDHEKVINSLNKKTLQRGKEIYQTACFTCHGINGTASLSQARSFIKDPMRFGNKPYDMWQTITSGAGMMPAQSWLSPTERYYVIQYIREVFFKKLNPSQFFKISDQYLSKLPRSKNTLKEELVEVKKEALKGALKYGQEWYMHNESNYGYAVHSPLKGLSTSVLTVKLDNSVQLSYDLLRMGTVAAWSGNLDLSETKFMQYRGEGQPFVKGISFPGLDSWQWLYNNCLDSLKKSSGIRAPLPQVYLQYHGHYVYQKEVILSYAISGREILEYPQAISLNNKVVLSQTLEIKPGSKEEQLCIGQLKDSAANFKEGILSAQGKFLGVTAGIDGNLLVSMIDKKNGEQSFIAAGIIASEPGLKWSIDSSHRLILSIPVAKNTMTIRIFRTSGKGYGEILKFASFIQQQMAKKQFANLVGMTKGGSSLWPNRVITKGIMNVARPHFDPKYNSDKDRLSPNKMVDIPTDYPYTVDNIGLPFDNAYNAWIRPTSLGFMSDGRLLIGTYTGDIWMARGIDNALTKINWQRIATGLYEPMGLKVVRDQIYVTCRNGIIRLNDFNHDGETDFYEVFHTDHDVSNFFHAFNFGLETDSKGNFYYAKPGEYTDNKDPGNLIKVSPDGKKWESVATGFRVNNGVTVTPDDRVFVSDNQGNWMPANKINLVEKGKYYGYVPNLAQGGWSPDGTVYRKEDIKDGVISADIVKLPDSFSSPALWIPQEFDNSPGGGVWSDKSWGPLGDHFIHTSYGKGWLYYFLPHSVGDITQGSMVALPFQMDAGIQRAAFNPVDKQLYTTGLTGWDDGVATQYGVLSRVRSTGGKGHLVVDAKVVKGGIELKFNFDLDRTDIKNISNYMIDQWNYKWTSRYGSADYSLKNPGVKGIDSVLVKEALLSADDKTIFLEIPEIREVNTLRIRFTVRAADGVAVKNTVYMTINKVPN
jgi:Cytochrome C oxidase, cbb3-type, subunit III